MVTTPCDVTHSDCNGTSMSTRIPKFYCDNNVFAGILLPFTSQSRWHHTENPNKFEDTSNQYFHVPRHMVRIFICDGPCSSFGDWDCLSCPDDSTTPGSLFTSLLNVHFIKYTGTLSWVLTMEVSDVVLVSLKVSSVMDVIDRCLWHFYWKHSSWHSGLWNTEVLQSQDTFSCSCFRG